MNNNRGAPHRWCFNEAAGFTQRKPIPCAPARWPDSARFNEAAGFTQRKLTLGYTDFLNLKCFNEAAGFTQRKPVLLPALLVVHSLSFNEAAGFTQRKHAGAGGGSGSGAGGFNEAAGFTQRKPRALGELDRTPRLCASMRPPVLPSGNST